MGVATLCILRDNFGDSVGTLASLGIRFLGSREGQYPYIHIVVEGECVPDANLVVATVHTERSPERHGVSISFEEILATQEVREETDLARIWAERGRDTA